MFREQAAEDMISDRQTAVPEPTEDRAYHLNLLDQVLAQPTGNGLWAKTNQAVGKAYTDFVTAPAETARNGAHTGALGSFGLIGLSTGAIYGIEATFGNPSILSSAATSGLSAIKGLTAATGDAAVDMALQKEFGHNIAGHDLFRPTGMEAMGMALAAVLPMDTRTRLVLAGASWLIGRVENYFDA